MENPFLSFVVTARNDNYGGNWTNRINAFIKVLAHQAQRTKLACELIFVEYNPPKDKKNMYAELVVPTNQYFSTRFIVVPEKFHATLPRSNEVTVCEFIGKNIGIRRAKGTYIIATNPDVIYSDELFDFFASNKLADNLFYRINRRDSSIDFVEPQLDAQQIISKVTSNVVKIFFNKQTQYVSYKTWLSDFIHGRTKKLFFQCPLFNKIIAIKTNNEILHENAAGDFLLMHRNLWEQVRGYDQVTVGSGILDSYIMYMLYCKGYRQQIIPYPIFHLYHDHKGVRYLASYNQFRKDADEMLKTKKPYKEYSASWGYPTESFNEVLISSK